jgi:hypothetical protein
MSSAEVFVVFKALCLGVTSGRVRVAACYPQHVLSVHFTPLAGCKQQRKKHHIALVIRVK